MLAALQMCYGESERGMEFKSPQVTLGPSPCVRKLLFSDDFTFAVVPDPLIPGDLTSNGVVDILDVALLAQYWMLEFSSTDMSPPTDGHCFVGMPDFAILSQNWLTGTE